MQRAAAILVGLILLCFLFVVGTAVLSYSGLVKATQQIDSHWEKLQELQRARAALLPKIEPQNNQQKQLVSTVIKGGESLQNLKVDPAHAPIFSAQMADYKKAYDEHQKLVIQWVATPQPASPLLLELQQQLRAQNLQRAQYNQQVDIYNQRIQRFPVSLVSEILGFGPRPFL